VKIKTFSPTIFREINLTRAFMFSVLLIPLNRERTMNRAQSLADTAVNPTSPAGSASASSPSLRDWGKVILFAICAGLFVDAWDTLPSQFAHAKEIGSQAIARLQQLTTDETPPAPEVVAPSSPPVPSTCTSNRPNNHQTVVIYRVVTPYHNGCR